MPLAQLPSLNNVLPDLSSTMSTVGQVATTAVSNAATGGLAGASTAVGNNVVKYTTIGIGALLLIFGLIGLTKIHQPIIAAGKRAARDAAVAAVAA